MATDKLVPVPRLELEGKLRPIEGQPGTLEMVPVEQLRIDLTYQRTMTLTSARLAKKIAAEFDWRRFVPGIGVRNADGTISLIDGQHRTAAAKARGVPAVPVYVQSCSMEEAAGAFAAINGTVTPMSTQDIFRARLVAGDPEAKELQAVLDVAGVTIVTHKSGFSKGETRSVNPLQRALRVYGRDVLILTLQCITETRDGNPGLITGATLNGIAKALISKTELLSTPSIILDMMDSFDLKETLKKAEIEFAQTGNLMQSIISREINAHFRAQQGKTPRKAVAA